MPVDGEKPRVDGQEAAGGGGGGGKALKGLRPKPSKLSKGKPKSGVKRSTTADQLAAAQVSWNLPGQVISLDNACEAPPWTRKPRVTST